VSCRASIWVQAISAGYRDRRADLDAGLGQQLGPALSGRLGLQGGQVGKDLRGGTELPWYPAVPGLPGGIARVQELPVQPLEDRAVDDLAVAQGEVSQPAPRHRPGGSPPFSAGDR
jgi:hypothetical protein